MWPRGVEPFVLSKLGPRSGRVIFAGIPTIKRAKTRTANGGDSFSSPPAAACGDFPRTELDEVLRIVPHHHTNSSRRF